MTRDGKSRWVWIVGGASLIVWLVMGWATSTLIGMEREQVRVRSEAETEARARLALWRLDSSVPSRLSRELAQVRFAADGLLSSTPPPEEGIVARFVVDSKNKVRTVGGSDPDTIENVDVTNLVARLEAPVQVKARPKKQSPVAQAIVSTDAIQSLRNTVEFDRRKIIAQDNLANSYVQTVEQIARESQSKLTDIDPVAPTPDIAGTPRALWVGNSLIVARIVHHNAEVTVHGSLLDWDLWQTQLATEIQDLLPGASLHGLTKDPDGNGRQLASLPAVLDAGPLPAPSPGLSPLVVSIGVGWCLVLAATAAVAWLVASALKLSERRANFVSAVTHELRTPLTTFRMYTEMLDSDMVDDSKRTSYVRTLRREADRLGHLVENVLAYARIESKKGAIVHEEVRIDEVLRRIEQRLRQRAEASKLQLDVQFEPEVAETTAQIDPTAMEQILFNLVDNAAKYGPSQSQPKLGLTARIQHCKLEIRIRDYGPGVPLGERTAIFEPFAKAEAHRAGTKPGVGIGLALSRDLARQMGGDLRYEPADPGAVFALELPIASSRNT